MQAYLCSVVLIKALSLRARLLWYHFPVKGANALAIFSLKLTILHSILFVILIVKENIKGCFACP